MAARLYVLVFASIAGAAHGGRVHAATEQLLEHGEYNDVDALTSSQEPLRLKRLALLLLAMSSHAAGWRIAGQRGHDKLVTSNLAATNAMLRSSIRMSSDTAVPDTAEDDPKEQLLGLFTPRPVVVLADPISKSPLQSELRLSGQVFSSSSSGVRYPMRAADAGAMYIDLVKQEPLQLDNIGPRIVDEFRDTFSAQTGMFRNPLLPFLYERGWRQNFRAAGFPGIDKEFAEVKEFFSPANGGIVVDLSCGSGLMSRRLVSSGLYARVFALDFSDEMLKETSRRFSSESIPKESLILVRADAAALPLQTGSVDALHAGAAMHCWPRLEESLAEVRRALKPGGLFFATTFFKGAYTQGVSFNLLNQQGTGAMYFFQDESELNSLLRQAGFSEFEVRREGPGCAIIRAVA